MIAAWYDCQFILQVLTSSPLFPWPVQLFVPTFCPSKAMGSPILRRVLQWGVPVAGVQTEGGRRAG